MTAPVPAGPVSARAPRSPDLGQPTTLLLVRHGRTAYTEQGRFAGGGGPDPDLSPAGRDDARRASAVLAARPAARPLDGLPDPVAVVSSPLRRTRSTAAAVGAALGLDVRIDEEWTEAGFGAWEGLTYAEVSAGWPEELRRWQGSATVAPPEGESLDEVVARVGRARARVTAAFPGSTVVVVSHVTPIRAVVREVLDAGSASLWRIRVDPCSITVVRFWADGGCEVLAVNAVPAP
ncbi:MAG: hypothetical protein GXX79_15465 [Actinomycetales bacterium]|nr:hypothetical protein [Actinomycetales bacterium]